MKKLTFIKHGQQTTLKKQFSLTGEGGFSGKTVLIICRPAPANSGIAFWVNKRKIKALSGNLKKYALHKNTTMLAKKDAAIVTTEHILSAFYGMGVDNVTIEMRKGKEIPVFDASSKIFAESFLKSGVQELKQKRIMIKVESPIYFQDQENQSFALLAPNKEFIINTIIDFKSIIGIQRFSLNLNEKEEYYKKICRARSFFMRPFSKGNWEKIRKTMKFLPRDPRESDIVVYNKRNFVTKLRYRNEPVRHKILDFLGDLSLTGKRFQGEFILYKPGHNFTHKIVREIMAELSSAKRKNGA